LWLPVVASVTLAAGMVLVGSPVSAQVRSGPVASVERQVWDELAADGSTSVWVYLRESADLTGARLVSDWGARGEFVFEALTSTAQRSQASLRAFLDARRVSYESFWIVNAVRVDGADAGLVEAIAARPDVSQVTATKVYPLVKPQPADEQARVSAVEWNVDVVRAPQVWDQFGVTGEGIVVGAIDTGAQFDHPAIVAQYRGNNGDGTFDHNYNWWDPSGICGSPSLVPCDNHGHGTHVTGTMVGDDGGDNRIGVAPGAKWMAAKGCEFDTCSDTALLLSGQFILAPTDLNGDNEDPEMRPHVVNNSWGGDADTDPWYQATVQAWVAAGIFPQFASGNPGPACGQTSNPGNLPESYAAGGFDINGNVYVNSGRGPSAWDPNLIKPNISAPAVAVRSSVPGGYAALTGTSMASPHVAGTVALMWSAVPELERDINATRALLDATAIDTEDLTCGGTPENNNVWGEGKLDAFAAVDQSLGDDTGTLSGTVTDADTGDPIANATVSMTGPVQRQRATGTDGGYQIILPVGGYDVTASAFGYGTATAQVDILTGDTTVQDFALDPVDSVTVSGTVTDGSGHGWPLYARVSVTGTTVETFTDPLTGQYSLTLPQGDTYELVFTAEYPGYAGHTTTVEVTDTDITLDVALTVEACALAPGYEFGADVGILGDFDGELEAFLDSRGIPSTPLTWSDDPTGFDVIIVNRPGDPGEQAFLDFLAATDASGTGLVMLDTWSTSGNGVWLLWNHLGNPATRSVGFSSSIPYLFYEVTQEHPILDGFEVGDEIIFEDAPDADHDHAWFGGYTGEGRQVIANAGRADTGVLGEGIGIQERANNRHVLLSMHGISLFTSVDIWTDDGKQILINSLGWASRGSFECVALDGGLVAGEVSDLNTGAGVSGALVSSVVDPEVSAVSFATPDDPGLGDGFFWLFSPLTGSQEFTASASGYQSDSQMVDVVADAVAGVEFALGAGLLVVEPGEVSAQLRLGQSTSRSFTVTNEGSAPASVTLGEAGGGFEMAGSTVSAGPRLPGVSTPVASSEGGAAVAAGGSGLASDVRARSAGATASPVLPEVAQDEVTITHSASQEIVQGNSVACSPDNGFTTTENGYLRAFVLSDFGLNSGFTVSSVSFGVESSDPAQPLTVNLYTLEGELRYANMTLIGSAEITLPPTTLGLVTVPVEGVAPAGSTLVVELDSPDLSGSGRLFIGSNSAGQTAPSYLRSESCGILEPTDTADLGFPGMHIVMNVTGTPGGGDVPWMSVTPQELTLAPGASATVTVGLDAAVEQPGTYTARVAIGHDTPYQVDPVQVTMVVTPPNNWGKLSGTITGTNCDGSITPIAGALVQVNGKQASFTLFTDDDGHYGWWMPVNNNPLQLIVAANGYIPQARNGMVVPRQERVEDFTLQALC